jgi:hypothetical protein
MHRCRHLRTSTRKNSRICWPAILAVFAVQMMVLITLAIAVANHSDFATASSQCFKPGLDVDDGSDVPEGSYKK